MCNNAKTKAEVLEISQRWNRSMQRWRRKLDFNQEASRWFRSRKDKLAAIKSRFTRELRQLENMKKAETNELFPQIVVSNFAPPEDRPDLNAAISAALVSYIVQTSPADYPFSTGYGDFIESTRSEKSSSKDWNLQGLRGTEAIQVSSHRGPPTDRPPDKPPPKVSVFAGCSQERANTLCIRRLASLCRSSRCLRGVKSSLAANAIMGSQSIIQLTALM
jgi:hypothetical protein